MVSVATGMQNLHCNLAALSMYRTSHNLVLFDLMPKAELRCERADAPREIGRDAAGDNEAHTTSRALGKVNLAEHKVMVLPPLRSLPNATNSRAQIAYRHFLEAALRFFKSSVHGAHDSAILELREAEVQRRH
jgi:hypothetical protein